MLMDFINWLDWEAIRAVWPMFVVLILMVIYSSAIEYVEEKKKAKKK